MPLLQPLLLDLVPEIQQMACSTLCRMAGYNPDLAEAMVQEGIVVQLLLSLRYYLWNPSYDCEAVKSSILTISITYYKIILKF